MGGEVQRMTVRKVMEFIDDRTECGGRTDVETVARYSGYSLRHMQRLFISETGVSIGAYIRHRRLTRAALLLRLTTRTLADISFSLGFDSQQSFNREFKKQTGFAPLQYRNAPFWSFSGLAEESLRTSGQHEEPGVVFLKGKFICGHEVITRGSVTHFPENSCGVTEHVFRALSGVKRELWWTTEILPGGSARGESGYRVRNRLGYTGGRTGDTFSSPPGYYFRTVFHTTPETHTENVRHIYLNVMPEYEIKRAEGPDIMTFLPDEGGGVKCTLFVPVAEMPSERNSLPHDKRIYGITGYAK